MKTFRNSLICIVVLLLLTGVSRGASVDYYFQYTKSLDPLLKRTSELNQLCQKDESQCGELETFSRNYLIKKVQAFGEFFDLVSETFIVAFPSLVDAELTRSIDDIKAQNTALKFTATKTPLSQIASHEEITNQALEVNAEFTDFLSTNFHYSKSKRLLYALNTTYDLLLKEEKAARLAEVRTHLVSKDLKEARSHLDQAEDQIKLAQNYYQEGDQNPDTTAKAKTKILLAYQSLAKANTSLLSASSTLFRLSQSTFWEDPSE